MQGKYTLPVEILALQIFVCYPFYINLIPSYTCGFAAFFLPPKSLFEGTDWLYFVINEMREVELGEQHQIQNAINLILDFFCLPQLA
jgi:hypothetical protein